VTRIRSIAALGAILLAGAGLSGCGAIAGDAVVQVGGAPITKATFAHWMQVVAAPTKTSPTSAAVVPQPPRYSACIAHLAVAAAKPVKGEKHPSTAELKSECEREYKAMQAEVLGFLISADWLIGESSSLGVKLSDAEVKQQLVKEKVAAFPEPAKFKAYLQSSGETVSDVLLNLKVRLLEQKLEARALKGKSKAAQQKAFAAFVKAFKKKWTAKTECRAGYVVEDCKQYKAPKSKPPK
jgi:foldase protein PrsA